MTITCKGHKHVAPEGLCATSLLSQAGLPRAAAGQPCLEDEETILAYLDALGTRQLAIHAPPQPPRSGLLADVCLSDLSHARRPGNVTSATPSFEPRASRAPRPPCASRPDRQRQIHPRAPQERLPARPRTRQTLSPRCALGQQPGLRTETPPVFRRHRVALLRTHPSGDPTPRRRGVLPSSGLRRGEKVVRLVRRCGRRPGIGSCWRRPHRRPWLTGRGTPPSRPGREEGRREAGGRNGFREENRRAKGKRATGRQSRHGNIGM